MLQWPLFFLFTTVQSSLTATSPCVYFRQNNTLITFQHKEKQYYQMQLTKKSKSSSESDFHVELEASIIKRPYQIPPTSSEIQTYEGFLGFLNVSSTQYLVFIKSSDSADFIAPGVREIKDIEIHPLRLQKNPPSSSSIEELRRILKRHRFFYSTGDYDVTRSFQDNMLRKEEHQHLFTWSDADERFFWNLNLYHPIIQDPIAANFITPVSNIWAQSKEFELGGKKYRLTLISRRSRMRQGPRYVKRGVDENGDVANFVETEQILRDNGGTVSSYLQVSTALIIDSEKL